jgi:hypothetical protein
MVFDCHWSALAEKTYAPRETLAMSAAFGMTCTSLPVACQRRGPRNAVAIATP